VSGEKRVDGRRALLLHREQLFKEGRQPLGIDADAPRVHHTFRVRLGFIMLAVARGEGVRADVDRDAAADRPARPSEGTERNEGDIAPIALL
jgi:hypothetical protein